MIVNFFIFDLEEKEKRAAECSPSLGKYFLPGSHDGKSDHALGVLEMGRLKPRDRRFYVVRPYGPFLEETATDDRRYGGFSARCRGHDMMTDKMTTSMKIEGNGYRQTVEGYSCFLSDEQKALQ